ncbi:hypothetical protein KIW84_063411 [Lathyrus oleraceus]|uniref:Uncharacterized protein n=1 Tax=Pisum sativum TaxID=3888 RepID=A0A9D5A7P9_PEA|nr:hypothetical protein KIW84_063411 [Pisum sativum]
MVLTQKFREVVNVTLGGTELYITVYPRVKVRVPEKEHNVHSEYDSGILSFLKLIQSLHFEEEENHSKSEPSICKNTKACPQHIITRRFTPSTKGMLKNNKQVREVPKEITRPSCVIRPRAVLSSPDNDELIGGINDLKNNISITKRKKDARGTVEGHAKVLAYQRQSSSKGKVHV